MSLSQSRFTKGSRRRAYESLDDVARSMKMEPLAEVARSIARGKATVREMHGPLMAYVVNFSSKHSHPHKFVYPICTKEIGRGKQCGKSLEFSTKCDHDSFTRGTFRYVYRFKVILVDYNYNGTSSPMRCNISEAASYLLDMGATEFSERTEKEQLEYVTNRIAEVRPCQFYLEVKEGDVMAHIFHVFDPVYPNYPNDTVPERRPQDRTGRSRGAGCISWLSGSITWTAVVWNSILKEKGKAKLKEEEDKPRPDLSMPTTGVPPLARTTSRTIFAFHSSRPIFQGSSSNHKGKANDNMLLKTGTKESDGSTS